MQLLGSYGTIVPVIRHIKLRSAYAWSAGVLTFGSFGLIIAAPAVYFGMASVVPLVLYLAGALQAFVVLQLVRAIAVGMNGQSGLLDEDEMTAENEWEISLRDYRRNMRLLEKQYRLRLLEMHTEFAKALGTKRV
ncbi:hypothetical protein EJ06DRAFT_301524 [Trichodelitschia bisporula]|uniref:Uncharacterized protein n=1 Tax=Trichodelitschia bisporula TaxID=703511 RepID=A0A6G1I718_9PEZI|nr:hypothetical protein EJ06DRAFT_301524 [Trichodelitschia bisporula]